MKRLKLAAMLGMALAILFGNYADFTSHLHDLQKNVLRLHILADSDSAEDQELKLMVRDALLSHSEELFAGCRTLDEMKARAWEERETIRLIAQNTLEQNGCTDPVTVQLAQMQFDTREYEEITMPSGEYEALRILIGKGEGHNWWCVMYPPLCLPAVSAEGYFDAETSDFLTHPEEYEVKFRCVELLEDLQERFSPETEPISTP
ncbi:MAG: stage II sporulation protein R [Oscillospiraceae bacterium]|nr:stage II sporulation protein R [Oscillospiraceae bacterium]